MKHRAFSVRFVALAAVGALLAGACSGGGEQAAPKKHRRPEPSTTTTTIPVPIAPFTGLPDPDGLANGRSSVAVKIENSPDARPQSGLDVADIVYEEVVEGGITRFWAVFNSRAPANIGPVRSVRAMDPAIVTPLGGVIAYSGGTSPNVAAVRATGLVWVDENNAGDAFYRESSRSAPHNLFARSEILFQRGGQPAPPRPMFMHFEEDDDAAFTGESIASFHVNFDQGYDVTYVWDAAREGWLRFHGTSAPFYAIGSVFTKSQVTPTNVIVQFVPYPRGAEGLLYGSGDASVFSNGQLIRGRWNRVYPGAPTTFTDAFGGPIALTPGRTWVELLPIGRTVDVVAGPPPTTATSSTLPPKKNQNKKKNQNTGD
ncbi:MAG: DUF3048 domain-containing protein [Acidimicrobiia bacterium]